MKIIVAAHRFEAELRKYLSIRIEKMSGDILHGVPVDVYKERCAELRVLTDLQAELPEIMKKAKD